jgi:hypothetical protein
MKRLQQFGFLLLAGILILSCRHNDDGNHYPVSSEDYLFGYLSADKNTVSKTDTVTLHLKVVNELNSRYSYSSFCIVEMCDSTFMAYRDSYVSHIAFYDTNAESTSANYSYFVLTINPLDSVSKDINLNKLIWNSHLPLDSIPNGNYHVRFIMNSNNPQDPGLGVFSNEIIIKKE